MSDERAGHYRYVRGRTVDPDTGRPSGAEAIPVSEVVEPGAEVLAPPPPRVQTRAQAKRGRSLGSVRDLEDTPWARTQAPRRRLPSQRALWTGSGALAAVIAMVVLGATHPEAPPSAPGPPAVPATVATQAPAAGAVVAVLPVKGKAEGAEVQDSPAVQVAELADAGDAAPPAARDPDDSGAAAALAAPEAPAVTPADPVPVRIETVRIAINATPWALIEIDGQEVGETPLAGVELAVGRHRFVAHMPDGTLRERITHVDETAKAVLFE